jgi:hypothetical protein
MTICITCIWRSLTVDSWVHTFTLHGRSGLHDPASLTHIRPYYEYSTHSRLSRVPLCIWYSVSDITIKETTFLSNNGHRIQFSLNKKRATLLQRRELMESCRFASKWDHTSIRPHKGGRKRKLDQNLFYHTPHKRDLCSKPLSDLFSSGAV